MTEDEEDEKAAALREATRADTVATNAVNQLLRMYQDAQRREHDLLDADGKLAKLNDDRAVRMHKATVEELSLVVDNLAGQPVRALSQRMDGFSQALKDNERRDSEQDKLIADLRARLERFERQNESFGNEMREIRGTLTELSLSQDEAPSADMPLATRVVLVVEDSTHLTKTLARITEARGARVLTAASLPEAEILVAQERPDVAIVDIRLGGADGFAVAAWLINVHHFARSRILLMTGSTGDDVRLRAGAAGLRVLTKPFGASQLVSAIQDSLAQPSEAPPG